MMSEEQMDVSFEDFTLTMDNPDVDPTQSDNIIQTLEIATEDEVIENVQDLQEDVNCNDEKVNEGKDIAGPSSPSESANKTPSANRELKLLLALSKEANLDTNIAYKRKSVEPKSLDSDDLFNKQQKAANTTKLEDTDSSNVVDDDKNKETKEKDIVKLSKRKAVDESGAGGAVFEDGKKLKVVSNSVSIIMNEKKKDPFCWQCHHEEPTIFCETCPRSFHQRCLRHIVTQSIRFLCPECDTIMKAEDLKQRSPAMQSMSLAHLCGLLKFALKRMMEVAGCEPFIHPVSETEFPEYLMYIVQPMDLTCLEKNIKANIYGSTQAFESDAKWLVHNSIIFNSFQSKLTSVAKSLFKICKQEMSEIENCASCYLNANTKLKTWFVEVCPKPHLLVWAKLKGFPFWPAKAMRTNSAGMVDVRFFGAHDRAWVSYKDCFLYSLKDPNSNKQKRNDINESIKEVKIYIENLEKKYGTFCYAEYRIPFEPDQEIKQLQLMLPNYDPKCKRKTRISRRLSVKNTKNGGFNPIKLNLTEKIETDPLEIEKDNLNSIGDNSCQKDEDLNVNNENVSNSSRDSFVSNGEESLSLPLDQITRVQGGPTNITDKLKKISILEVENGCKSVSDDISESNSTSNLSSKISNTDLGNEKDLLCPNPTDNLSASHKKALEEKLNSDTKSPQQSETVVSPNKPKISDILIMKLMKKLTAPINQSSPDAGEVDSVNLKTTPVVENANEPPAVQDKIENVPEKNEKNVDEETDSTNSNQVETVTVIESNVTTVSITKEDLSHQNNSLINDTNEKMDIADEAAVTSADSRINDVDNKSVPEKMIVDVREETESVDKIANSNKKEIKQSLDSVTITKKRRRSEKETNELPEDEDNLQKKTKTDSNIEISTINEENSLSSPKSILESRLITSSEPETIITNDTSNDNVLANESSGADSDCNSITIKNEPLSDGDLSGTECNQSLPRTSSTLNSSEKEKSETTKAGFKVVDNLSKVIDEVASNFSQAHANEEVTITKLPKRKEIFIKPLSKLQQNPKQRARKTFPMPAQLGQIRSVYSVQNLKATPLKTLLPTQKKDYSKTPGSKIVAITSTANKSDNILYVKSSSAGSFLPNSSIIYTGSTASIINMVPKLLQATARGEPGQDRQPGESAESQNYIPQSGATLKTVNSVATVNSVSPVNSVAIVNSTSENSVNVAVSNIPSLAPLTSTQTSITNNSPNILDELQTLSSMVPEPLNKAISDLMFRPPPKLKPRPPGPLSMTFDEGLPSSAGNVTSKVNSISHRLGDYLRGMLIELLQDMGRTSSPEAEIANLKLEIEQLKHKHSEELLEIKKNIGTVLKDVQKSIVDERNRVIEETRTNCEAECVKRVEEAKAKQWCANCSKEAQFYCCWNTSYCDYPCQQRHWAKHMSKCTQSMQNNQSSSSNNNPVKSQQLLLRPTAPPKNFTKSIVAKPTKVLVNNRIQNNKNSFNFSGNHLTLVESAPGSFELLGNGGPISVGGKFITGLGKVKTTSTSSLSSSTTVTGNTHKAVIISHTKPLTNSSSKPAYVTSSISEIESD